MNEAKSKQDLRNAIVDLHNNLARARDICVSMLDDLEKKGMTIENLVRMQKRQKIMEFNYLNPAEHSKKKLVELTDKITEEIIETL